MKNILSCWWQFWRQHWIFRHKEFDNYNSF